MKILNKVILSSLLLATSSSVFAGSMSDGGCVFSQEALDKLNASLAKIEIKGDESDYIATPNSTHTFKISEIFDFDYDFKIMSNKCPINADIELIPTGNHSSHLINPTITFLYGSDQVTTPYYGKAYIKFEADIDSNQNLLDKSFYYKSEVKYRVIL